MYKTYDEETFNVYTPKTEREYYVKLSLLNALCQVRWILYTNREKEDTSSVRYEFVIRSYI